MHIFVDSACLVCTTSAQHAPVAAVRINCVASVSMCTCSVIFAMHARLLFWLVPWLGHGRLAVHSSAYCAQCLLPDSQWLQFLCMPCPARVPVGWGSYPDYLQQSAVFQVGTRVRGQGPHSAVCGAPQRHWGVCGCGCVVWAGIDASSRSRHVRSWSCLSRRSRADWHMSGCAA